MQEKLIVDIARDPVVQVSGIVAFDGIRRVQQVVRKCRMHSEELFSNFLFFIVALVALLCWLFRQRK